MTKRSILAAIIVAFLTALALTPAFAATSIWSNIVGGFPTWYGAATCASVNVCTIAAPLPTYPQYTLVTQQHIRTVMPATNGTNTGSVTLNVNSTGALPVVVNTITGASVGALTQLVGGELVAGVEYDLTYSTSASGNCSNSCYILSWLARTPVLAGTTQTITAAQWASMSIFEVTTSAQTLTLPQASTVSTNGGAAVLTGANSVTITPNATDAINYGGVAYAANTSVILPPGTFALVTAPSSGNISISTTPTFVMATTASFSAAALGAQ